MGTKFKEPRDEQVAGGDNGVRGWMEGSISDRELALGTELAIVAVREPVAVALPVEFGYGVMTLQRGESTEQEKLNTIFLVSM